MIQLSHDRRIQVQFLGWALTGCLLLGGCLVLAGLPKWLALVLAGMAGAGAVHAARSLRRQVLRPFHTFSNLMAALRQGDFSFRATVPSPEDAVGFALQEANALSELLQRQRLETMEATSLVQKVLTEIEVAVFAFDAENRLSFLNRAGEALLGQQAVDLLGQDACSVGLFDALSILDPVLLNLDFPGRSGRFEVRGVSFRQDGKPHRLLMVSDLTWPLREEERQAWHRLIRVLSHEINNSLAPIHSLAESLARIIARRGSEWEEDATQGLAIIGSRAQALNRFMESYARLAKLPDPRLKPIEVAFLVRRAAEFERRVPVQVAPGPPIIIQADADQLEQVLINLIRNAVEANEDPDGAVTIGWNVAGAQVEIWVEDEGRGLPTMENLFVPFFTTKPTGAGIGLVLSRQIAEGHHGGLLLERREPKGAKAILRLPIYSEQA